MISGRGPRIGTPPLKVTLCGLSEALVNAAGGQIRDGAGLAGSPWLQPSCDLRPCVSYLGQCCTAQVGVLANRAIFAGFREHPRALPETRSPTCISRAWGPAV